ncbi:hypothetical protein BRPE64_ACDS13160 [Caballeronia insecticola]|uniref:Uncharacterized protein n=1 Tax=Caballeronia insecticola TaxID=758793 RepID=R4WQ85_9BURK|nr:hypothetical protein BRPE64_ACDS13160 [Caballeronia insecticola]
MAEFGRGGRQRHGVPSKGIGSCIVRRLSHPARTPSKRYGSRSLRPVARFIVENAGSPKFRSAPWGLRLRVVPREPVERGFCTTPNKKAAVPTTGTSG